MLRRPEQIGGEVVDVEFAFRRGALEICVAAGFSPPDGALKRAATRMFQLRVDTSEFIALAAGSERHRWVAEVKFGRLLCGSTLFEDIVKIVATTNTTWTQTKRMVSLLVDKCGGKSPRGFSAFPAPEDVVRFSERELQDDCRLGYRAKSIHSLATGIIDGTIDLDAISDPSQSTDELFASYKTFPGIGPYGAAHLLAMDGRHDFIAVDSEFRRFVAETYHGGRRVSDKAMLRRYTKWGRWKYLGYWSELWSSVADRLQPR
ncbi:MAG TPA: hypothetical protein VLU46_04680 [Thermoanaerobaculia bacterium]|nr:hypothetical protein [Thermoanaerobaculia bacterium]